MNEEDDDNERRMRSAFIFFTAASTTLNERYNLVQRSRISWNDHVNNLIKEGTFQRVYRMTHKSFQHLVDMVHSDLTVNHDMSYRRTGTMPIIPEIIMHCLIRYMSGGSYIDICLLVDVSITAFYNCVRTAMKAIINCKELKIKFPKTTMQIIKQGKQFKKLSTNGIIDKCVGCIDGVLIRIKTPSVKECGSVKSFYSGHYAAMGLNVQASCDHLCRFNYISVAAPGGSHDLGAYSRIRLSQIVENLPTGYYVIGDNAYMATEHLITPFSGCQKNEPLNPVYNFYCAQVRIRIEMAFGLLTTKWRIFRSPLQMQLKNASKVVLTGAILHNYVINENNASLDDEIDTIFTSFDGTKPTKLGYVPSSVTAIRQKSQSVIREHIVQTIHERNLTIPVHNLVRNANRN
jgi:hypothetical protein